MEIQLKYLKEYVQQMEQLGISSVEIKIADDAPTHCLYIHKYIPTNINVNCNWLDDEDPLMFEDSIEAYKATLVINHK